ILESLFFWSDDSEGDILEGAEGEKPRRKRKRIAELLETGDADDLLALVFTRIVKHYGGNLNVMDLREHERVFLLAYDAWGIIGNGGFNYLFERSIPGDPHYLETAAAFKKIGCIAAAEAFTKALCLFPGECPPEDIGERLRIYRSGPGTKRASIDEQFF